MMMKESNDDRLVVSPTLPAAQDDPKKKVKPSGTRNPKSTAKARDVDDDDDKGRIKQPSSVDIVFGRGKPYQGHSGNIRLHQIVDIFRPRYSQARRHEKTEIAEEIVQLIKTPKGPNDRPSRFLKKLDHEEAWVEVSDSVARDKVSHALRGKSRKESSSTSSQGPPPSDSILNELLSLKRASVDHSLLATSQNKRPKIGSNNPNHPAITSPGAGGINTDQSNILAQALNAHNSFMQTRHPSQLFPTSGLPEMRFSAHGLSAPLPGSWGMGLYGHYGAAGSLRNPSFLPRQSSPASSGANGSIDPRILQHLAAERQLRGAGDPRFWM